MNAKANGLSEQKRANESKKKQKRANHQKQFLPRATFAAL